MITPGYGLKCGVGLIIMGLGFVVMIFAAQAAANGKVAVFWLILTYFLHTVGELVLSPISLSAVSKLSPPRFLGQMMGLFVLTYSMGNIALYYDCDLCNWCRRSGPFGRHVHQGLGKRCRGR